MPSLTAQNSNCLEWLIDAPESGSARLVWCNHRRRANTFKGTCRQLGTLKQGSLKQKLRAPSWEFQSKKPIANLLPEKYVAAECEVATNHEEHDLGHAWRS